MNEMADFWYHERGINIFPLDNDKRTYENWSERQSKAIPDQLHEEWKRIGRYAKGIILMPGKVWRGVYKGLYFVGIDFDKELGFKEFCNIIDETNTSVEELKEKYIVEQHDGDPDSFHVYFYSEIPFTDKTVDNLLGIEIKSNCKGLMCCTPSYHSKTKSKWQIKGTNLPIILNSDDALRLMFNIDDICIKYNISYLKIRKNDSIYLAPLIKEMINSLKINSDIIIKEGERHYSLLSIANSLLFKYWTNEADTNEEKSKILIDLMKFFYEINSKLCKPEPIPEKELKNIWISCIDYVKRNSDQENSGSKNESKSETHRVLIKKATEQLMSKYNFLTIEESKDILFYENGIYKKGGEIIIEKELEMMFGYSLKSAHISSILGHIKRRTYIKFKEFDKDLNIINLRNGLYNRQTGMFEPHSPNYPSLNQKTITYDPIAKPQLFGKFLKQVLYPEDIRTAIDSLAYTFIRENLYELIFILVGIGANGKNVFTGILSSLHGFENVSNISLKSLLGNQFAIAGLENKDVNVDTELPQGVINDISTLKRLTGKQPVSIERKGKDAYDTKLYTKLFFCANTIPSINDNSDARFRREAIITFPNQFQEGINADPRLLDKLTTEEEKSGIFNVLMNALKSIRKNDMIYLNEKTIQERRKKHELISDPIDSFIKDAVAQDSICDDFIVKDDFYLAYKKFCNYHKLPFENKQNFGEILKRKFKFTNGRKIINGNRKTVWIGIRLVKWTILDPRQKILIAETSNSYHNDNHDYYNREDNNTEDYNDDKD